MAKTPKQRAQEPPVSDGELESIVRVGAERLTGSGDLLYKDFGDPVRLQAPFLTEDERKRWLAKG